jgi:KilA-N domain
MSNLIVFERPVNGIKVRQRRDDGYINATAMSKAHHAGTGQRRDISEWLSNARTQESIKHLSLKTGIPVFKLIDTKPGRYGGTWIHSKLATRFAIWLSDEFGYLVEEWVAEWMLTGRNPVDITPDEEYRLWQQRYDIRVELRDVLRPELMNAVIDYAHRHSKGAKNLCIAVHDEMNRCIQGSSASSIRELGGLPLGDLLRDYFEASPLVCYSAINQFATNAIIDNDIEPVNAVRQACEGYLGKSYQPKPVKLVENVHSVGHRLKAARKQRRLAAGIQLDLLSEVS